MKPKNPFPELFSEGEARRINEMRFRLTKVLKEFNRRGFRYKAKLSLHTCFPYHCKTVVYCVELVDSRRPLRALAYTTFRWNLRTNTKHYLSTNADDVTTLEDTLNIVFLTTQLAVEFFKD